MISDRSAAPGVAGNVVVALAALAALSMLAPGAGHADGAAAWPRQFDSPSGSIVIYQPQPEDLNGDLLTSRAAFSLQKTADGEPIFGVLWFDEHIQIDRDSSTVTGRDLDVTKVRLPGSTPEEAGRYEALVESEATHWDLSGSLDELKAGLAATEKERASVADLSNAPPKIVFSYERAFLVLFDGAPSFEPIEGSNLERAVNTPYAVVRDPASHECFLSGANVWYRADDPRGPWTAIPNPPPAIAAVVPPDTSSSDRMQGTPPKVVTATIPTELISIDGQPQYAPLVGDELLYVTNTESDVLRLVSTQALYVLLAGRWYTARTPAGPWTFVRGDQLPTVFRAVSPDSPKGNILASVAGTDQAADAVADAEIPQTSPIRRDSSDFQVLYDDVAQFEPIRGTSMKYAVNTDAEVIFADGRYYACAQGVWYVSDTPNGPWRVSETRPLGVDDIPPDCPVYDVRYVYIYSVTPSYIYFGYLPGYLGCYPYYGTVVYGTGYWYRPWHRHHRYYPRPCTWGFHARYNPWLGRWSFGYTYWSGFMRVGYRWRPMVHPGMTYAPPRWYGSGGYRRPLVNDDLSMQRTRRASRMPARQVDTTPMNIYRRSNNVGRIERTATRLPLQPIAPAVERAPGRPNNVFAGRDGKVYQRDEQGNWKVNQGRGWVPTPIPNKPGPTPLPSSPAPGTVRTSWPRARPAVEPHPVQPSERRTELPPPPPQQQPQRPQPPSQPPSQRPQPPSLRQPAAPAPRHDPGNLEKEFRARQRSGGEVGPGAARPAKPEPAKPRGKKEK
jgi:hypothetical protein